MAGTMIVYMNALILTTITEYRINTVSKHNSFAQMLTSHSTFARKHSTFVPTHC